MLGQEEQRLDGRGRYPCCCRVWQGGPEGGCEWLLVKGWTSTQFQHLPSSVHRGGSFTQQQCGHPQGAGSLLCTQAPSKQNKHAPTSCPVPSLGGARRGSEAVEHLPMLGKAAEDWTDITWARHMGSSELVATRCIPSQALGPKDRKVLATTAQLPLTTLRQLQIASINNNVVWGGGRRPQDRRSWESFPKE